MAIADGPLISRRFLRELSGGSRHGHIAISAMAFPHKKRHCDALKYQLLEYHRRDCRVNEARAENAPRASLLAHSRVGRHGRCLSMMRERHVPPPRRVVYRRDKLVSRRVTRADSDIIAMPSYAARYADYRHTGGISAQRRFQSVGDTHVLRQKMPQASPHVTSRDRRQLVGNMHADSFKMPQRQRGYL